MLSNMKLPLRYDGRRKYLLYDMETCLVERNYAFTHFKGQT